MNMIAAEMFAPKPTTVFSALIWWNGPIFAQVEDGQGERAGGGAEIAGIHADETHARPQPPWIVAQCAVRRFAGDSCGPLTLMRLRQRLRHGVARGSFLTWVERDDKRAEQDERRHGEFEDLRRQFEQQQAADDAADSPMHA